MLNTTYQLVQHYYFKCLVEAVVVDWFRMDGWGGGADAGRKNVDWHGEGGGSVPY